MGTDFPLVSVVIPNYNYGRYVREAVDSVLGQTYPAVEVIVVDDGSSDDSLPILQSYGSKIKLVVQPNGGVHKARNRGIEESKGEFVAFLDADDVWEPTKLERQVERFTNPRVGFVHCGMSYIDVDGKHLGSKTEGLRGSVLKQLILRDIGVVGPGSTSIVRKECFSRVGMFSPGFAPSEDFEFSVRVAAHYEFEFCPEPLVRYRQHPVSASRDLSRFEKSSLAVIRRAFKIPGMEKASYKRKALGVAYRILAGTFYQAGKWHKALWYGLCALAWWPPEIGYLFNRRLGLPFFQSSTDSR